MQDLICILPSVVPLSIIILAHHTSISVAIPLCQGLTQYYWDS
jgi:hypothetical protein